MNVPAEFRYLDDADTETVLTKMWGNPPTGERTLGMLVPANIGPDQADRGVWADYRNHPTKKRVM